jgi:aspartate/glutamate racemase
MQDTEPILAIVGGIGPESTIDYYRRIGSDRRL